MVLYISDDQNHEKVIKNKIFLLLNHNNNNASGDKIGYFSTFNGGSFKIEIMWSSEDGIIGRPMFAKSDWF